MIKRILLLAFILLPVLLSAQVTSILTARAQPVGSTITVRGIVTNGSELGKIRYLQDGSAGIAAYPGSGSVGGFEASVSAGDSIQVTGTLVSYHGLLEITPITAYSIIAANRPLPASKHISLQDISEEYESQLLGFECVTFNAGGTNFSSGAYEIRDADGHTAKIYIGSGHPLIGQPIPGNPFFLNAILSEYDDYQLLPRTVADFSESQCFYFTEQPQQSAIASNGFDLSWATNLSSVSKIHYGDTPALGNTATVSGNNTEHVFHLNGLSPGTIYWIQIESEHNGTKILSKSTPFATRSLSSGEIKVFFNRGIDASYANGFSPDGQTIAEVVAATIARIDAAQQTLDVAMYNNNRADLTNAVKNAHNRGVRVRYVAALDASNTALNPAPAFPLLYGNNQAIMHDKFLVIDADLPDKAWVMSGSLNWTNQNINSDFNNTIFIQDQSLARAYELEFEEMWGGSGTQPDPANSRFASNKLDNTPHRFIIGGQEVESWFSPSDRTTERIVEAIYTAESEALFATFSFTKNEMGDALVDVHNSGIPVRGMIENISDPGVEYGYLNSAGIQCRAHSISGDLHHKYGVFDANGNDPIVVTGSHNWTVSAETVNDENTLIIHDFRLASLYKAEFEKRWQELGAVSTSSPDLSQVKLYPNPVSGLLNVELENGSIKELSVRNLLGEIVFSEVYEAGTAARGLDVQALPAGSYVILLSTQHERYALSFQKI